MDLFSLVIYSLMIVGGSFTVLISGSYIVYKFRKKSM